MDEHTKGWLDKQPQFHRSEMFLSMVMGFCLGIVVGAFLVA